MNILEEGHEIIQEIEKTKEKAKQTLNEIKTIEQKLLKQEIISDKKSRVFKVSYLINVIQFLDLNSILNLSIANKQFYQFFTGIYYYKFISQIKTFQKKQKLERNLIDQKSTGSHKSKTSGLLSKLTGGLFYFGQAEGSEGKVTSKKEILKKIDLHRGLLLEKLREFKVSKEINDLRENIDKLIEERYTKKDDSDKAIEKIKREKIEKEYFELQKELENLKGQTMEQKNKYEKLQKEDIDQQTKLNIIRNYLRTNFNKEVN